MTRWAGFTLPYVVGALVGLHFDRLVPALVVAAGLGAFVGLLDWVARGSSSAERVASSPTEPHSGQ